MLLGGVHMSKLKDLRKRRGLTQQQLSELSGVSQQYISDIETGDVEGSLTVLRKLAKALDVSVTKLIEEKPIKSKSLKVV